MKDLGILNNWTKIDLARVIGQALFNADKPLKADNIHVKRMQSHRKAVLISRAADAIEILSKRTRDKENDMTTPYQPLNRIKS